MASKIFGTAPSKKPRGAIAALMMAKPSPSAPPADDEASEDDDESGETCKASVTDDDLQELEQNGSVTVQAETGEKVVLTKKESAGGDPDSADESPSGMTA